MYKLTHFGAVLRIADGATIPRDPNNADYAAFLSWEAAGNTPLPADPPPKLPAPVVSRFQARAALHLAGRLADVQTLMDQPGTDPLAKLAWSDAQEFHRDSPTVLSMASALGMTDADLDNLFATAAGIKA
jgi:hypothetical protein